MTVYVVLDCWMFGSEIAGIYTDEIAALRHAHEEPLPQNVIRRKVEPHTLRSSAGPVEPLT